MSRQSLFSLHNTLPGEDDAWERFELNAAAVDGRSGRAFALSIVCLGPTLGADEHPLALTLACDGEETRLAAVEQRCQAFDGGSTLTVALFDASRALLDGLVSAAEAEVRLLMPGARVVRRLSASNRANLRRFVDSLQREDAGDVDLPMASVAG
ncbi:MAG: hypothetical protein R3244_00560 [Thermoanaerobaculia bacterium]|nr:hypothetical protein [Thermoanaerobaculia bacterium]